MQISVEGGKYEFRLDGGLLSVRRFGEPWWVPDVGGKAIIALMAEVEELRAQVAEHHTKPPSAKPEGAGTDSTA